jgi:two-component system sensor histidine kinase DegS
MLTIVIEDDGRGFDPSAVTITRDGGFGVQTMRERIELVGGTLRVDSAPGRGTKVIAMVPMPSVAPGSRTAQPGTAE